MNLTTRDALERALKLFLEEEVQEILKILYKKPSCVDEIIEESPVFRSKSSYTRTLSKMMIYELITNERMKKRIFYKPNVEMIGKVLTIYKKENGKTESTEIQQGKAAFLPS